MVNLKTFLANLKKAARDNTPVYIGGGEFTPEELNAVIVDIERLIFHWEMTK